MIEKTKNLLRHYAEMVSIHFKNGKPISKKKPFIPAATYINTEHKLESFVKKMKYVNEISVDIEGNSLYTYYPKICLIQISTRSENFIIDPLSIKNASLLDSIFSDKNIQKVFHGATYDTQMLYSHLGIIVNNLFDTQIAVSFLGEKRTSLDFLVEKNFNVHLEKKYQKSNWAIRPLSKKMLEYAISDTKYL
ncbi:MAG TPA: ribonuclease D, partial [bacterium]|nr:ribonuclease D [bacterium]